MIIVDIIIIVSLLLLTAAFVVAVVAKMVSLRKNRLEPIVNNIPARRIAMGVTLGGGALLVATFSFLPADSLMINGDEYSDGFWIRVANMTIVSSCVLLVVATLCIVFSLKKKR